MLKTTHSLVNLLENRWFLMLTNTYYNKMKNIPTVLRTVHYIWIIKSTNWLWKRVFSKKDFNLDKNMR